MSEPEKPEPKTVRFHYIKGPAFHTLHVDGVIGGITPRGEIHLAFYVERMPIPTQTEHTIKADGSLGEEIRDLRVARQGIIRELPVDIMLNAEAAERLHDWLGRHVEMLKQRDTGETPTAELEGKGTTK